MKKILFVIVVIGMCSCTLFRKTTKTTDQATHTSSKELESTELILKSAGRETQIFTYWNDSGFYQYRHVKEQVDQARSGKINTRENQQVELLTTVKKSVPVNALIYIGLIAALVIILILVFKIHRFLNFWHNK